MAKKIVIATDVRYWRRQTGAQQRIFALVKFLCGQDYLVTTCFTSSINEPGSHKDSEIITAVGLEVTSLIDDWRPDGIWEKAVWQAKCIANATLPKRALPNHEGGSKPLEQFQQSQIAKRFQKFVAHARPEVVIVEYVTLAYLVPHKKDGIRYAVDTHDFLSHRCELFRSQGFTHWVDITEEQEINALNRFDVVMAIQGEEAKAFDRILEGKQKIVVAGHPAQLQTTKLRKNSENVVRFGLIASANPANTQSVRWFLDEVWNAFGNNGSVEFCLAGSVCKSVSHEGFASNVRALGRVEELSDFYAQIDVAVNPIQFGTGLKIKTLEAFSFLKPLISSAHGVVGVESEAVELPCRVCDGVLQWREAIRELTESEESRERLARSAGDFVESRLASSVVFADLHDWLEG
jgi:glycosyltransferase involved in cell wall biosynthesis